MVCIHCGGRTQVINSRAQRRSNQVWRRRQCQQCHALFSTEETANYGGSWSVRSRTGTLRAFWRDKLLLSLYHSCQHRPAALRDASALTDTVIKKVLAQSKDGVMDAQVIAQTAQVALNRFDIAASTHYRAFHP